MPCDATVLVKYGVTATVRQKLQPRHIQPRHIFIITGLNRCDGVENLTLFSRVLNCRLVILLCDLLEIIDYGILCSIKPNGKID